MKKDKVKVLKKSDVHKKIKSKKPLKIKRQVEEDEPLPPMPKPENLAINLKKLGKKKWSVRKVEKLMEKGFDAVKNDNLNNAIEIYKKLSNNFSKQSDVDKLVISHEFDIFKEKLRQEYPLKQQERDESLLKEKL